MNIDFQPGTLTREVRVFDKCTTCQCSLNTSEELSAQIDWYLGGGDDPWCDQCTQKALNNRRSVIQGRPRMISRSLRGTFEEDYVEIENLRSRVIGLKAENARLRDRIRVLEANALHRNPDPYPERTHDCPAGHNWSGDDRDVSRTSRKYRNKVRLAAQGDDAAIRWLDQYRARMNRIAKNRRERSKRMSEVQTTQG